MKRFLGLLAIVGLGIITWIAASTYQTSRFANSSREKEAAWQKEKAALESQLHDAQMQSANTKTISPRIEVVEVNKKQSPAEIIANLKTLRITSKDTKNIRLAIQQLENLIELGTNALPEIQAYLATQEDIDYDPSIFGSWKVSKDSRVPIDFVFPPSLRFGLFDAVRKIGSAQAEKLLADTLRISGRGVEVAYLARVLQEIAPFQYRELAVTAAKDLLNNPLNANSPNAFDKYERNYLYGVLAFYKDGSLIAQAQSQLMQADGKVDQGALNYLKETLAEQVIPAVAQLYQNGGIADAQQKEPLARLALNYAGADPQADALYRAAIKDPNLTADSRRELIEDLNQDGFDNSKNFSARDVQLIRNRLALIKNSRDTSDSKIITDAFDEAEKDLKDMLAKATQRPTQ